MKTFIKNNFAVLLAFALPIILIIAIALSVYIPSLLVFTDYNFVYATCTTGTQYPPNRCNRYLDLRFTVVDGELVVNEVDTETDLDDRYSYNNDNYNPRLFLHDTEKNESREITVSEAQSLTLSPLLTSPDGVSVSSDYERGPDLLFLDGGSSFGYFLKQGSNKKRINLIHSDSRYSYRNDFRFIGWVLE